MLQKNYINYNLYDFLQTILLPQPTNFFNSLLRIQLIGYSTGISSRMEIEQTDQNKKKLSKLKATDATAKCL